MSAGIELNLQIAPRAQPRYGYRTKNFNHHCRQLKFAANNIQSIYHLIFFFWLRSRGISFTTSCRDLSYTAAPALTLYCLVANLEWICLYPVYFFSFSQRHNSLTYIATDKCYVSNKVHVRMYQLDLCSCSANIWIDTNDTCHLIFLCRGDCVKQL